MELSEKQKKFCEYYAKNANATESAKLAGYSEKTAHSQGPRMLAHVGVQAYIQELTKEEREEKDLATKSRIADAKEILEFLSNTMRGEVKDAFGLDPGLQDRIKAGVELAKRIVDTRLSVDDTQEVEIDPLSQSLKELGDKL